MSALDDDGGGGGEGGSLPVVISAVSAAGGDEWDDSADVGGGRMSNMGFSWVALVFISDDIVHLPDKRCCPLQHEKQAGKM